DFLTGAWDYTSPASVPSTFVDHFSFTLVDGDNDRTAATALDITVPKSNLPVANNDIILTNFDGVAFDVPEWAFLANDTDPNALPLDISGVSNQSDLVVTHTAGAGTNDFIRIDDENNADGGSFDYTATNGSLSDTGSVTVFNINGGGNVNGTAANEILVGDGNGNTFNGLGGMDIILAGGGDDTIVADQNDLVIDGGSGTDTLSVSVNFNDVGDSQITGIEDVLLTAGGLTLILDQQTEGFNVTGSSGADNITTGSGNDTIAAMAGVDAIDSGGGSDTIVENAVVGTSSDSGRVNNAGSGNDTGQDTVTGFDFSNDILRIDATNVNSFTHGIDTTIGTAGGTDSGVASSFTTTTGLINLNHNGTFGDSGDVAVTFASPIGTFDEANFEARLQYHITGSGGGDTITTGQLDDMIDGGAGSDILNGGAGADSVTGGTGEDIIFMDTSDILIDGGSNQNNDLLTVGNRGDVMVVSGTNNFTALGDNYQNIETLSMLNADGSTGNSTVTLDIADVLQMADTGHAGSLGVGYSDRPALRVDGDAGDVVNLDNSTGTWLLATGATGVPAGYTAYSHVTSGGVPTTNEDAYVMVATGVTVNLV
ncbi:MAG TPA: calcium-binding protein, partial [Pseudolabrys sp.]|nr:calcium-binding protein [Pseudolabrys sp.]